MGKLYNIQKDFEIIKVKTGLKSELKHYNKSKLYQASILKKIRKTFKDSNAWINFDFKEKGKLLRKML